MKKNGLESREQGGKNHSLVLTLAKTGYVTCELFDLFRLNENLMLSRSVL